MMLTTRWRRCFASPKTARLPTLDSTSRGNGHAPHTMSALVTFDTRRAHHVDIRRQRTSAHTRTSDGLEMGNTRHSGNGQRGRLCGSARLPCRNRAGRHNNITVINTAYAGEGVPLTIRRAGRSTVSGRRCICDYNMTTVEYTGSHCPAQHISACADSGSTPDEVGCLFQLPAAMTCTGGAACLSPSLGQRGNAGCSALQSG